MPPGVTEGGQGRVQTERQNLGHMPLLKSVGGVLWVSWARAGSVNSEQRSGVSISPTGVISKGHIRHTGTGRQGRIDHRLLGKSYQDLYLLVTLWLQSRTWACMGRQAEFMVPAGHLTKQNGC